MNIESVIKALEGYLTARGEIDGYESSLSEREQELERARAYVSQALAEYIGTLAAEVDRLKQSLSENVYRLNKLRAEQARLQARGEWASEDLSKLLRTLAELGRKGL